MDITKAEWQQLTEEMRELSGRVKDMQHGLESITGQVRAFEEFRKAVEPNMWFVNGAKAIVTLFAVFIVSTAGYGLYLLGSLNSDVKHHSEAIAE